MELKLGEKVKIHSSNGGVRDGELIYISDYFITVRFKNYPESFQFFEFKTANIRLELLR